VNAPTSLEDRDEYTQATDDDGQQQQISFSFLQVLKILSHVSKFKTPKSLGLNVSN
jgi:hypothetical protein